MRLLNLTPMDSVFTNYFSRIDKFAILQSHYLT